MTSEERSAERCPICNSPDRKVRLYGGIGGPGRCGHPWHDATPQPAPDLAQKILDTCDRLVQPAQGGFEDMMRSAEAMGYESPYTVNDYRAAHAMEVEEARRPYLVSCPWCQTDQSDKPLVPQISHLVACGDKQIAESRAAGIEEGRRQALLLTHDETGAQLDWDATLQRARAAGKREMAREALTNKRVWSDAKFMAWLERAGEEKGA